jgi:colanic acid/amylovoran biosynthesis glycosyltransferase
LKDKKINLVIYAKLREGRVDIHDEFRTYNLKKDVRYEPQKIKSKILRILQMGWFLILIFKTSPKVFLNWLRYTIPINKKINLIYSIKSFLTHESFDILHAHFGPLGVEATILKNIGVFNCPVICSFHGFDVDRIDYRSNKNVYTDLFKSASILTVNSKYTFYNLEKLGCPRKKIRIIPESLKTANFNKNKYLRKNDGSIVLISIGRLVEFKGFEFSIRAVHGLISKGIANISYHIIGSGPLELSLIDLVSKLNLQNVVRFWGSKTQDEIRHFLSNSDIFVLTGVTSQDGRQENQGLVIQEAQAMNLPVIVSDIGGVPEGMIDGVTGILVRERDVEGIISALESLINRDELRINMGIKGREFVEARFDTEIINHQLLNAYKEILA